MAGFAYYVVPRNDTVNYFEEFKICKEVLIRLKRYFCGFATVNITLKKKHFHPIDVFLILQGEYMNVYASIRGNLMKKSLEQLRDHQVCVFSLWFGRLFLFLTNEDPLILFLWSSNENLLKRKSDKNWLIFEICVHCVFLEFRTAKSADCKYYFW